MTMTPPKKEQITETENENTSNGTCSSWSLKLLLEENNKLRLEDVQLLREFCTSLPKMEGVSITDQLLVALLHCSDYDMSRTRVVATKHFETRNGLPEVFSNRDVDTEEMQTALEVGFYCALPKKLPQGERLFVISVRDPTVSRFQHSSANKAQFLAMDACIHEEPTTAAYVFLCDMKLVRWGHIFRWNLLLTRKIMKYLHEGIPLKIKQFHFLNTNPLTYRLLQIIRPMVAQELWDLLSFHTSDNFEGFWESVPKEYLPEDFGGDLPDLETIRQENIEWYRKLQPKIDDEDS